MPGLLARIGMYVIAAGISFDCILYCFGGYDYHFPLGGLFSPFLLSFGILLLLASGFVKLSATSKVQNRINLTGSKTAGFEVADTPGYGTIRRRRWPLRPRFNSLPSRGLISFSLAVPLIVVMWIRGASLTPIGFRVYLLPVSQTSRVQPATGTLTLRIDAKGRYYLDSKLIAHEELANSVARLTWPAPPVVYLYADPNLDYQDVIAAIDALRGLRANVVLLTQQQRNNSIR